MRFRRQTDFALLETITVGIAAIVIGMLFVPPLMLEYQQADNLQTVAEVQRIAAGLLNFSQDTHRFPNSLKEGETIDFLKGPGKDPFMQAWQQGKTDSLTNFLPQKPEGFENWKGPYIGSLIPDPWGQAYVVNLRGYQSQSPERVWVVSAGPNGIVDTTPGSKTTEGDDVGMIAY